MDKECQAFTVIPSRSPMARTLHMSRIKSDSVEDIDKSHCLWPRFTLGDMTLSDLPSCVSGRLLAHLLDHFEESLEALGPRLKATQINGK